MDDLEHAVKIINHLKKGGDQGCWCDIAIGSPIQRQHTMLCLLVTKFIDEHK